MLPPALATAATPQPAPPAALDDPRLQGRLWRGSSLGGGAEPTRPSGFAALDAELPGGGWPTRAAVELLTPQAGVLEWRLLAPTLRHWWQAGDAPAPSGRRTRPAPPRQRPLLLVNPPHTPHLPGLQALGLPPSALIWVATATPAEALWAAEQAVKARVAVLAWLPEARPEQIRRLQVSALGSEAPLFLLRPQAAARQSSAAPLRLSVQPGAGEALAVHLLKRRGPAHEGWLLLPALPDALAPLRPDAGRTAPPVPALTPAFTPALVSALPALPAQERPHALARTALHA